MSAVEAVDHRHLMGHWTTGVSLVTTLADGEPHGCTLNALSSLSLEPPSLIVCLGQETRTLAAIRRSGRFAVNVLAADQAPLSRLFANRALTTAERFAAVPHDRTHGVPVIDGCVATAVCEVLSEQPIHDHVVVVGRVAHATVGTSARPLVFFRGGFI
ncbi:flavin reductase family protein [Conexibacter sp. JD483]|uniref:flavin reductase family protein n=1 Tax=unclassified Conexibacter TaxID=2627773 RepID=UPI0027190513|nr:MULTISPECIES: flavin reductase family protein [unclassified Conexibacter]MDO8187697.1 flavin reductase family protein [Conexibacter sp. CPCC 205706]MDO8199882.1 flavin reductase family protein [Conexibacter sp. CPCC 205762]MDR9372241.1 flavin reductase family protein [Conexibacter sp. JD483]